MAGNLAVPQGLEAKIVWQLNGQDAALNILHFRHGVGQIHSQARADQFSALVKTAFTASALSGVVYNGVTLARVETRHMDSNSDPWFIGAGAAVPGVSTGHPLPASTTFVITLRTGLRGRSFNGRMYLWGYTEDANDALGGITAAARSASEAFAFSVYSEANSTMQLTQCVLSRYTTIPGSPAGTPPTERNPPILTTITTLLARDSRWDVQRRRAIPGV